MIKYIRTFLFSAGVYDYLLKLCFTVLHCAVEGVLCHPNYRLFVFAAGVER